MRIITEPEFDDRIRALLANPIYQAAGWVTGPGRSGAVAAVYASHILHIPFVPYGSFAARLGRVLVVDTASESGATMRKACRRYTEHNPMACVAFHEPPRVAFWYEAPKPQAFKHEDAERFRAAPSMLPGVNPRPAEGWSPNRDVYIGPAHLL